MQPLAIIDFLDEEGKPDLNILQSPVFPEIDLFGFQGFDEALGGRIVVGVSFSGHADPEAVFQQHLHVVAGGILNAPVGMMDDPLRGIAMCDGHPESIKAKRCIDVRGDGISYGPASEEVQDDRQVHEAVLDTDVGDVRHPDLVWTRDGQVLHQVGINPMGVVAVCRANPSALGLPDQSSLTHDAQHLLVVARSSSAVKLPGHPAVAVARELLDDCLDTLDELRIIPSPVLWLVVICAAGQVHEPAPPFGAFEEVTMLSNEPALFFGTDKRPL